MTDRYAVIGNPISHSKSPQIHTVFARQTAQDMSYVAIHCEVDQFKSTVDRLRLEGFRGLNVTVPFKRDACTYANTLSDGARRCGAVNALKFAGDKSWGENTDGIGLTRDLEKNIGALIGGARVLVIGAGGAARGVVGAILDLKPSVIAIANRTLARADELAALFACGTPVTSHALTALEGRAYDIVINATSAGLHDEAIHIPPSVFAADAVAYEMVYGRETPFMATARRMRLRVHDGVGMLVEQAAEAFFYWRAVRPDTAAVLTMLRSPQ